VLAAFTAHGSPVSAPSQLNTDLDLCIWRPHHSFVLSTYPCFSSPCLRYYSEHLSTIETPSPCISRWVGDPAFAHIERSARVGAQFVSFNQIISGRSSERAFRTRQTQVRILMSPRQVCCDGPIHRPLETWVQPIQVSPCVQDLRCITLHTSTFNRSSQHATFPFAFPLQVGWVSLKSLLQPGAYAFQPSTRCEAE
jgi:hypothetical protein